MKDRGLNPTFDDVLVGLERARNGREVKRDGVSLKIEKIEEEEALRCVEDAFRKRAARTCACGRYVRRPFTMNECVTCGLTRNGETVERVPVQTLSF